VLFVVLYLCYQNILINEDAYIKSENSPKTSISKCCNKTTNISGKNAVHRTTYCVYGNTVGLLPDTLKTAKMIKDDVI